MASLVIPVHFIGPRGKILLKTLIDTGAEMSLIPEVAARRMGVPIFGTVSIKGAGKALVKVGRVSGIEIPGAKLCHSGPMMVWVFGRGNIHPGTGIHAILGYDFMKKVNLQINLFKTQHVLKCMSKK